MVAKKHSPFGGFRPGLRVLITEGTFAGTEGRVIGPEERQSLNLPEKANHYWVIVHYRNGETAVEVGPEGMKPL